VGDYCRGVKELTWDQVLGRRLARHCLIDPAPQDNLVEVVRTVCGIHAQVMPAAELSLGLRVAGITRQDVRQKLWERRGLVKTYGIRGTVHLFPADELAMWMSALRANPLPQEERRLSEMGLDPAQKDAVLEAIGEALDGTCLIRGELGAEVARLAGSWALDAVSPAFGGNWPRWQMALGTAAVTGQVCFGPNQGTKVTFVRQDQWTGSRTEVDGETALREIFKRYLWTYGPATHREFAQWFRMQPGVALELVQSLADELQEVDVEGHHAWILAGEAEDQWPRAHGEVRLLPHFDCYVVGGFPRDQMVSAAWKKRVPGSSSGANFPVVIVDGQVAGLWRHRRKGRKLEIVVDAFVSLSARLRKQVEAAAARIGEISEAEVSTSFGPVEARPHL
jgi:hypothetical protein